jgi:hypothetical protein
MGGKILKHAANESAKDRMGSIIESLRTPQIGSTDVKKELDSQEKKGLGASCTRKVMVARGSKEVGKLMDYMNKNITEGAFQQGLNKDDKIMFIKSLDRNASKGTVWLCGTEPKPNQNAVFFKLKNNGDPAAFTANNMLGLDEKTFSDLLSQGYIKVLQPGETGKEGKVDLKQIRGDLQAKGYEKWTGKAVSKGITISGNDLMISVFDDSVKPIYVGYIQQILSYLKDMGIETGSKVERNSDGNLYYSGNYIVAKGYKY